MIRNLYQLIEQYPEKLNISQLQSINQEMLDEIKKLLSKVTLDEINQYFDKLSLFWKDPSDIKILEGFKVHLWELNDRLFHGDKLDSLNEIVLR
ncbi:hypothetical protein FHQ30_12105, partial [Pasteurellaceae bacterium Phil11]